MCKKLIIVTNCDPKRISETEQRLKEIYLSTEPKPALTFFHKETKPYEVSDKSKEKKPVAIIFDETVLAPTIAAIKDDVCRKMNDNKKPRFIHINKTKILNDVEIMPGHEKVREALVA